MARETAGGPKATRRLSDAGGTRRSRQGLRIDAAHHLGRQPFEAAGALERHGKHWRCGFNGRRTAHAPHQAGVSRSVRAEIGRQMHMSRGILPVGVDDVTDLAVKVDRAIRGLGRVRHETRGSRGLRDDDTCSLQNERKRSQQHE